MVASSLQQNSFAVAAIVVEYHTAPRIYRLSGSYCSCNRRAQRNRYSPLALFKGSLQRVSRFRLAAALAQSLLDLSVVQRTGWYPSRISSVGNQ